MNGPLMDDDETLARHRPTMTLPAAERERMLAAILGTPAAAPNEPDADERDETLVALFDLDRAPVAPRRGRGWVPAAAAAAVVIVCAGGLAAWDAGSGGDGPPAGGGGVHARATCAAALPATWRSAYAKAPLKVAGHPASTTFADASGHLLVRWQPTRTTASYGLARTNGGVTPVATFRSRANQQRGWQAVALDGADAVFGYTARGGNPPPTTDLLVVDAASRQRTHLVSASPEPKGWIVASDVIAQGGYVYWGATPRDSQSRGMVIRYSIADGTYRVLARLRSFPTVVGDARGVAWPGGSERAPGAPKTLEPLLNKGGEPVDRLSTDGRDYTWQLIQGDQTIVYWADHAGHVRVFRIARLDHGSDSGSPTAVAGPFVFLYVNARGRRDSVLDTRTGAIAPVDSALVRSYPGHRLFAVRGGFDYRAIDPARLPKIHC